MNKLTVVIPYRDRFDNLKKLVDSVAGVECVDFLIVFHGDKEGYSKHFPRNVNKILIEDKGVFNTGLAQNVGIGLVQTEWIMKQDVDCVAYEGFYQDLLDHIEKNESAIDFMIVGVFFTHLGTSIPIPFEKIDNRITKDMLMSHKLCGNEYVARKKTWKAVGGCEEFDSWGWEDYAFEYKLAKHFNKDLKIDCDIKNVTSKIRDELVQKKCQEAFDQAGLYMIHNYHKKEGDFYHRGVEKNKERLLQIVNT